jgi:hypothetical protein
MEQEHFLSGYCRVQDQSRMVAAVTQNGKLLETDCSFPDCPYSPGCPVAEKIQELIK